MKTTSHLIQSFSDLESLTALKPNKKVNLVFCFGSSDLLREKQTVKSVQSAYPQAEVVLSSTSGEILGADVYDGHITIMAIEFEKTEIKTASFLCEDMGISDSCGAKLIKRIPLEDLNHVMVFSDGLNVNGSALVQSLTKVLPDNVVITGGLAGDQADFKSTCVGLNDIPQSHKIVLVGFYGDSLKVGYGSVGGWDSFGPQRKITNSSRNKIYEIDGEPVLPLYKKYLGDLAKDLPSSGLRFPLSIRSDLESVPVVRTILSVDEADQSLIFAGDTPEGYYAQLMKANVERLIDGAERAAQDSFSGSSPQLAILISCVGRKLVLKQRTEEEIEAVHHIVGSDCAMTGFYSYGEIAPTSPLGDRCKLHNQTMTITTFEEA